MERLSERAGQEVKKGIGARVGKGGMQKTIAARRDKGAQKYRGGIQAGVAAQLTTVGTTIPQQPHLQLLGML